ncbi:hypothetical protein GCM10010524_42580 [Streptomyces mexicanus]
MQFRALHAYLRAGATPTPATATSWPLNAKNAPHPARKSSTGADARSRRSLNNPVNLRGQSTTRPRRARTRACYGLKPATNPAEVRAHQHAAATGRKGGGISRTNRTIRSWADPEED